MKGVQVAVLNQVDGDYIIEEADQDPQGFLLSFPPGEMEYCEF